MYKLIIFDLDGTLLNTSLTIQSVINESLKKFSLPPLTVEQTKKFVGNGARKLVERAVEKEDKELIEKVYADYSQRFANCSNELSFLYDGAAEALQNFRAGGILLAIVTNKPQGATDRVYGDFLANLGFSEVLCQTENTPLKPNPASTLKIMRDLGVKPEECLFVGDGETDVQTAANAGVDCVSVLWGYRSKEQLKSAGARVFAGSFKELENLVLNG
ncbi:MAG: HAD family hydrolase [Clostridia bacterium]|nr:HAD family hydrolase [Clostridia bacterium]